jgi:hypothetical protein
MGGVVRDKQKKRRRTFRETPPHEEARFGLRQNQQAFWSGILILIFKLPTYQVEPLSRRLSLLAKSRCAVDYPITKLF